MKTYFNAWIILALLLINSEFLRGAPVSSGQPAQVPPPTPYAISEQDGNSRVWQRMTYEQSPSGEIVTNVHSYTELESGMNHLVNDQWVASSENIEVLPNGTAAATNGQHQAFFPGDIYQGQIELVTPDGQHLKSRPVELSYFDGTNIVPIAELTNSIGQVLGTNQVVYPNAFTDFKADLVYTYKKGGFEQDIVLREQPPTPESFGLSSQNTRLQVLTEFFDTVEPAQAASVTNPQNGLGDTTLAFGQMQMVRGKAFSIGNSTQNTSRAGGFPVYKSWVHLDGRTFLVEELPLQQVETQLKQLPVPANAISTVSSINSVRHKIFTKRLLTPLRLVQANTNRMQLARADLKRESGLVLDYVTLNTDQADYTFQGDTTYYISSPVAFSGQITFEGGTVIKFPGGSDYALYAEGTVVCKTASYRPAIFTAVDDNSVGDTIAGSSGTPSGFYSSILYLPNDAVISHCRFSYAFDALASDDDANLEIWDCQFLDSWGGFCPSGNAQLHNVLFGEVEYPIDVETGVSDTAVVSGEFVTASPAYDLGGALVYFNSGVFGTLALTNSIVVGGLSYNWDDAFTGYTPTLYTNTVATPADNSVFQTVGAGDYYLTNGSSCRNAGTTSIDQAVLADIATKTTYPPVVYSNVVITTNITLAPQALRDTNSSPDLGYHYDPLDYFVDYFQITNATLTIINGAAIAADNESAGIWLQDGSSITSIGTPLAPNWLVRHSSVQEQPIFLGGTSPSSAVTVNPFHSSVAPNGQYRFTKFACPAGGGTHLYHTQNSWSYTNLVVQNCEFWGGANQFGGYSNTVATLKNNLFARCVLTSSALGAGSYLFLTNNLFWGDSLVSFRPAGSAGWYALNNAFDSCSSITSGAVGMSNADYNVYFNCAGELNPTNASDMFFTNALAYQTGPLGGFYQPTSSPLINMGSTTAAQVGLYHYTVTTNQVPETNSIVDIGYHYVATDAYGNPLDSNGNGIPDYIEDTSGSGQSLTVSLITPLNSAFYTEPATIPIQATVFDWQNVVTNVTFFRGGSTQIAGIANMPYVDSWPIVAAGAYSLTAVAQDTGGISATSGPVSITVTNLCSF